MGKDFLLAIDLGTSSLVVSLVDLAGNIVQSWQGEQETHFGPLGQAEQEARNWWELTCRGIRGVLERAGIKPGQIAGIGVAGTSWLCLPVDKKGVPLRPAMLWLDRRADEQARMMRDAVGAKRLTACSGNPVDAAYIAPKMLWLQENEPEVYKKTYKFLQSNGYLVFQLTGNYSQDYSQGYGFHFFDITQGKWEESIAAELGISLDLLAPLCQCHHVVGTVTRQAALETGLVEGIPVVAGGLDAACCTLGAGVIEPGQTQEQGGQAGGMSIQLDTPVIHEKLILGYHVLPNQWLLQGGTVGGGGVLRWFNENFGAVEQQLAAKLGKIAFAVMSDAAAEIEPGSGGLLFLPYMAGERSPIWDSQAKGVFFGLSYEKTRAHLIRSLMEGVGYWEVNSFPDIP